MIDPTAETLKPMRELHETAMEIATRAFAAKSRGESGEGRELFKQAFEKEAAAARLVAANYFFEPTRSILLRSAASLAFNAGLVREAEQLACLGLSGNPTDDVAQELRELLEEINLFRHLNGSHAGATPHPVVSATPLH